MNIFDQFPQLPNTTFFRDIFGVNPPADLARDELETLREAISNEISFAKNRVEDQYSDFVYFSEGRQNLKLSSCLKDISNGLCRFEGRLFPMEWILVGSFLEREKFHRDEPECRDTYIIYLYQNLRKVIKRNLGDEDADNSIIREYIRGNELNHISQTMLQNAHRFYQVFLLDAVAYLKKKFNFDFDLKFEVFEEWQYENMHEMEDYEGERQKEVVITSRLIKKKPLSHPPTSFFTRIPCCVMPSVEDRSSNSSKASYPPSSQRSAKRSMSTSSHSPISAVVPVVPPAPSSSIAIQENRPVTIPIEKLNDARAILARNGITARTSSTRSPPTYNITNPPSRTFLDHYPEINNNNSRKSGPTVEFSPDSLVPHIPVDPTPPADFFPESSVLNPLEETARPSDLFLNLSASLWERSETQESAGLDLIEKEAPAVPIEIDDTHQPEFVADRSPLQQEIEEEEEQAEVLIIDTSPLKELNVSMTSASVVATKSAESRGVEQFKIGQIHEELLITISSDSESDCQTLSPEPFEESEGSSASGPASPNICEMRETDNLVTPEQPVGVRPISSNGYSKRKRDRDISESPAKRRNVVPEQRNYTDLDYRSLGETQLKFMCRKTSDKSLRLWHAIIYEDVLKSEIFKKLAKDEDENQEIPVRYDELQVQIEEIVQELGENRKSIKDRYIEETLSKMFGKRKGQRLSLNHINEFIKIFMKVLFTIGHTRLIPSSFLVLNMDQISELVGRQFYLKAVENSKSLLWTYMDGMRSKDDSCYLRDNLLVMAKKLSADLFRTYFLVKQDAEGNHVFYYDGSTDIPINANLRVVQNKNYHSRRRYNLH